MAIKEKDPINELRQVLYPVFQTNGVTRVVAYQNKERATASIESDIILMVESGFTGLAFCVLLDEIYSTANYDFLTVLDIQHFKQWSEIDNELALEGTEIYSKEPSKNELNHAYLKSIRDIILKVQKYCSIDSYEKFEENSMLTEACEYNLRQIAKLSEHIDLQFKEDNPQIPWNALRGLQWSLTSNLPGANKKLLWEIIQFDFPGMLEKLEYVIKVETPKENSADEKE